MAHFAKLDENNIVEKVIVVSNEIIKDENENEVEQLGIDFCKSLFGQDTNWVQTSFNWNIRKQYAGVGYIYDSTNDVFIVPQPFTSWVLDSNFDWQPPIPYPTDRKGYEWNDEQVQWDCIINIPYPDDGQFYLWNEETLSWDLITE